MKNCDKLRSLAEDSIKVLEPYIKAIESFSVCIEKAWSTHLLPGWEEAIEDFKAKYTALFPSYSTKSHVLCTHLIPYLKKINRGMALDSEQVC